VDDAFVLAMTERSAGSGTVGKIAQGPSILKPTVHVLADEQLSGLFTTKCGSG